jgi:drug/metabolite transporter (DMT)-like permease
MTATALGLVLAAAVLHAAWNLLAKRAGGGAALVWLYGTASAVILTPPIVALFSLRRIDLGPIGLAYTLASAVLHVAYFLALQKGYEHGDLSVVYPVARGTGPVLSTIAAVALLGERPSLLALAGAGLVAVGVFVLTRPEQASAASSRGAVASGVLTGVLIAAYTICDKQAVSEYGVPPLVQQWGTSLGLSSLLAPWALRHRREVRVRWALSRREVVAIGVLVPTAYILVLAAMTISPVSYVAPAREVSILFASLMGTHLLSEGRSGRRLVAAVTMVVGVVALALG